MKYYKIFVGVKPDEESNDESVMHRRTSRVLDSKWDYLSDRCGEYSEKSKMNAQLFLSSGYRESIIFGLIINKSFNVEKHMKKFILDTNIPVEEMSVNEITFSALKTLLNNAERHDYISDYGVLLQNFEIESLSDRFSENSFSEGMVSKMSKSEVYKSAEALFALEDSIIPEIDRIFTGKKQRSFMGHPVNYLIQADDEMNRKKSAKLLINSLYRMGRIENKRYTDLFIGTRRHYSKGTLEAIYRSNCGGVITISLNVADDDDEDVAYGDFCDLDNLCEIATGFKKDVLTILCLPRECKNIKKRILENMCGCTFVEIREELSDHDKALDYLKIKACNNKLEVDDDLISAIDKGQLYHIPELNKIYDDWYGKKLKTDVFAQYKEFEKIDSAIAKEKAKGSAYDELNEMIGLKAAKDVINQALDNYKALKLFKDKGIVADKASQHMIFTGNPGTAKTTVARLFARIMKENDLLESGHIIELGRGDLVGKYVGWTAPTVIKKFKDAKGGILFIDEAYSLVDDRNGSFGDEAINTIVQEMENHRDDLIVIFAGYPDKMETFMKKNPGLRSRIAHHVHFDDYTPEELCDIAKLIAKNKGVTLDSGAMEKIHSIMKDVISEKDFGNGRYVRNIIERAKMAHNSRLIKMDLDSVTKETVTTLTAEDITIPDDIKKKTRPIGFAV